MTPTTVRIKLLALPEEGALLMVGPNGDPSFGRLQTRTIEGYKRIAGEQGEITYSPWTDVPVQA